MKAWTALLLSWLIPGSGFMMYGRWARGTAHFVTIVTTFCIGLAPTVQQAVGMLKRGGTAVLVGVVPVGQMVELHIAMITLQEKCVTGSMMGSNRFRLDRPRYVDFYLDGRLKLDEMISARLELSQVNEAFDSMRKGEAARSVLVFDS